MPPIEITPSSSQQQVLTSSTDGINVVARLQAKSHFFLQDGDFTQSEAQAFGVIDENTFRTSAKVTPNGEKQIFTICQGQVLLQPQEGNAEKVNVIFHPFKQPITGLSIKYFIYRGLRKSDFINGNEVAPVDTTGFTQFIWDEFNKFHGENDDPPIFTAASIGYSLDFEETKLIDDIFFPKKSNEENSYNLPIIPRGTHLGKITEDIGIDVILDYGSYTSLSPLDNAFPLNLSFVRAAEGMINLDANDSDFKKKLLQECCTQFIDIAAFYGLHANGAGEIFKAGVENPITEVGEIYNLLDGFFTKNRTYLYIQGDRRRSYNFYGNYIHPENDAVNLKIATADNNIEELAYEQDAWPIYTIDTPEKLSFQLLTDNYEKSALYVQTGVLDSEHEANFVRGDNLLQINTEEDDDIDSNYTKPLQFMLNKHDGNSIATIIQILYKGKPLIAEDTETGEKFIVKDIDNLFGLLNVQAHIQSDNDFPSVIAEQLELVNFGNDIAAVRHKKVVDEIQIEEEGTSTYQKRISFESLVHDITHNASPYAHSSSAHVDLEQSSLSSFSTGTTGYYQPKPPYYFDFIEFTDSLDLINGIVLKTTDDSLPAKKILGITEGEYAVLLEVVVENNLVNSTFFLKNELEEGDTFVSTEGVKYSVYSLEILGEVWRDGGVRLNRKSPEEQLIIYSCNDCTYQSAKYSTSLRMIINNLLTTKLYL